MRKGILTLSLLLGALTVFLSGCYSAPACPQPPWVSVSGDLVWIEDAPIKPTFQALSKAVEELGLSVTKKAHDGLSGLIYANTVDGQRTVIKLKAETVDTTRVSIRAGLLSNVKQARVIYQKSREYLP